MSSVDASPVDLLADLESRQDYVLRELELLDARIRRTLASIAQGGMGEVVPTGPFQLSVISADPGVPTY